ncbi:MAG: DHH family phosphoesterase [bacterium]
MNILITANSISDLDGVACAVCLTHFLNEIPDGHQYFFGFSEGISEEAKFVMERLQIEYEILDKKKDKFDRFYLVDFSEKKGLPEFIDSEKVIRVIDHRAFPDYEAFPNAQYQIELVGAAATLIAEKYYFGQKNIPIDLANLLLCAIYSNTVNFKATVTTERDRRIQRWLEAMVGGNGLAMEMFEYKTKQALDNLEKAMEDEKKDFLFEKKPAVLYQLELVRGESILKEEKYMKIIKSILKSQKTEYSALIVQDITEGKTYIYSTNKDFYSLIDNKFEGNLSPDGYYTIPEVTMRKVILARLMGK